LLSLYKSDQVLIERIAKGDDTALADLYHSNFRMIIRYITANSGTQKDAQEQLQDALVVLWEKVRFGSFTLNSKLSTYIYGIVKNRWRKELTRQKRFTNLEATADPVSKDPLVSETLQETELITIIKSCMTKLSPICREILTLFYYEEKSMDEISTIVGLANEKTAKSKKYQCKKELEFLLRSYFKENEIPIM
jgi:RNA polymerase sigma factor (sigma-70 family)